FVDRRGRVGPRVRVDPDRDHRHLLLSLLRTGATTDIPAVEFHTLLSSHGSPQGPKGTGLNEVRAARSTGKCWVTHRSLRDPPTPLGSLRGAVRRTRRNMLRTVARNCRPSGSGPRPLFMTVAVARTPELVSAPASGGPR